MNPRLPIRALATGLGAATAIAFCTVPANAEHAPGHTSTAAKAAADKNKPCPPPKTGTPAAGGQTVGQLADALKGPLPAVSEFLKKLPNQNQPVNELFKGLDLSSLTKNLGPLGGLLTGGGLPGLDALKNLGGQPGETEDGAPGANPLDALPKDLTVSQVLKAVPVLGAVLLLLGNLLGLGNVLDKPVSEVLGAAAGGKVLSADSLSQITSLLGGLKGATG